MTEQFMNDIKASPYFERIVGGHDVIMVSLTGSRLIDITDERSDFDLIVVTNDNEREEYVSEYLKYYSKKVHWHYVPVTKIIANEDGNLLTCNGEVEFIGLEASKILYVNPKYLKVVSFLLESKATIATVGAYGLVRFHNELIDRILAANEIKPESYCKYIYHLCFASYVLLSEEPQASFLTAIKRIRWKPVSDEYKALAVERIRLLRDYVAEHPLDLNEIIRTFNEHVSAMLK